MKGSLELAKTQQKERKATRPETASAREGRPLRKRVGHATGTSTDKATCSESASKCCRLKVARAGSILLGNRLLNANTLTEAPRQDVEERNLYIDSDCLRDRLPLLWRY